MQIYLSSTLDDLRPHRDAVMDTLRKEGHLLKDSYEATPEPTALQCVQDVASSELYVGVFAWRYGWIPPGQADGAQLSITEIEYQAAVKAGKPRLIFLATKEDSSYPFLDLDKEADVEGIRKLRKLLSEGAAQTSNQFKSPDDLALKVSRAVRLQADRESAANAETQRRERGAPRGESGLMGGSAPPHPQRLAIGLLLLGVRGTDDVALARLRDALPADWSARTRAWVPDDEQELAQIDELVARSRCVALLISKAGMERMRQSPCAATLFEWIDTRLEGAITLLLADVTVDQLPPWPRRCALPVGQWLATPGAAVSGEMADLQLLLPELEPDLKNELLIGLSTTTIAMTLPEAEAFAADPGKALIDQGPKAHDYFDDVARRLPRRADQPDAPDWAARYGAHRELWRPFANQTAAQLTDRAVTQLNAQPFYSRQEYTALLGNHVRLRRYPFDPELLVDDSPALAIYAAMRQRGCLVLIDELSILHPQIRAAALTLVSDARASVATLSPLDPCAATLDRVADPLGPFSIGTLIKRFLEDLDPRCEFTINSPARLRRWLRLAIPQTLAATDTQVADPDQRENFRKRAFASAGT